MRRILLGAAMAAMLTGTGLGPALAQGNQFQTLVYVNDAAVTRYELDQRLRFMQVLRAPDNTPETAEKALIDDRQFIASMIPHHSGAILMCREAALADQELVALCAEIIEAQRSEIDQMERIAARLD